MPRPADGGAPGVPWWLEVLAIASTLAPLLALLLASCGGGRG